MPAAHADLRLNHRGGFRLLFVERWGGVHVARPEAGATAGGRSGRSFRPYLQPLSCWP